MLEAGDLASKLTPPVDARGRALPDRASEPGFPSDPRCDRPARDPGLRMRGGSERLPRPGLLRDPAHRATCLARFAHHELMAVELFAWALLRWPAMPRGLRRGLVSALADEQRHCRLYLDRLAAHGVDFATDDHSDYFWRHVPAIAASPHGERAFLAAMGLTLEQANLDFTLTYRDGFAAAGDAASAAVCQQVHDDEIRHGALAARWLTRLGGGDAGGGSGPGGATDAGGGSGPGGATDAGGGSGPGGATDAGGDLADYLASVPFPLGPARAKGRRFEVGPRRRAGLSEALIEHVRQARSSQERGRPPTAGGPVLLPNLGAEEGSGRATGAALAAVREAARLWALLFARSALLCDPGGGDPRPRDAGWPADLGDPPSGAVWPWLEAGTRDAPAALAWLATPEAADRAHRELGLALAGPDPACVRAVHDKAFAVRTAQAIGALPPALAPLIEVLEPAELAAPETALARIEARIAGWPSWTAGRFTLKPRHGSSGRGRAGGVAPLRDERDRERLRRALPRLAARGGAVLEPWLDRERDLSVCLYVPPPAAEDPRPTILGSLEMLVTPSGVYRGHLGELDSRGRVFSGDPEDESLRAEAAAVASRVREAGFHGACGIDSFVYRAEDRCTRRGVVEVNARATMGLVAIGLVRRALDRVRAPLLLEPGLRRAFGFALVPAERAGEAAHEALARRVGPQGIVLDLRATQDAGDAAPGAPRPLLVFARERSVLRAALGAILGLPASPDRGAASEP